MSHVDGQVVFYAAAAGKYAYDDDEKQNGVFTTAVIEVLRCKAATDERGLITVETLAAIRRDKSPVWIRNTRIRRFAKPSRSTWTANENHAPVHLRAPPQAVDEKQIGRPVTVTIAGTSLSATNEEGTFSGGARSRAPSRTPKSSTWT